MLHMPSSWTSVQAVPKQEEQQGKEHLSTNHQSRRNKPIGRQRRTATDPLIFEATPCCKNLPCMQRHGRQQRRQECPYCLLWTGFLKNRHASTSRPRNQIRHVIAAQTSQRSMRIPITIHGDQTIETKALIDTGAGELFVDYRFAKTQRLPLTRLTTPIRVYNADGTRNEAGDIIKCVVTKIEAG